MISVGIGCNVTARIGRYLVPTASVVFAFGFGACNPPETSHPPPEPTPIGRTECARCHEPETKAWTGSQHDLAMEMMSDSTALGDFNDTSVSFNGVTSTFSKRDGRYFVKTDGPNGELTEFELTHTFGVYPLQQYLIPLEGGRLQALGIAWDSRPADRGGQRWFHLYPDEEIDYRDELHWTSRDQNWNYQCAECHSTGLRKNFDLASDSYETTWDEIDVSCEACHGPGSTHAAWASDPDGGPYTADPYKMAAVSLASDRYWVRADSQRIASLSVTPDLDQVAVCARCHARRGVINDVYDADTPFLDTHRPALLEADLYFSDGQIDDEVYVYGSFLQSRMYQKGVVCSDCHNPHTLEPLAPGNALCAQCHAPDVFDSPEHTFHAKDSLGSNCVDCHMPGKTYMVVDPRRDHSFRIPRPDLSEELGTPNACNGCHESKSSDWAAEVVADWFPKEKPPHFGEVFAAARLGSPGSGKALAELAAGPTAPIVRATALSLLEGHDLGQPGLLPTVIDGHQDADGLVRLGAIRAVNGSPSDIRRRVAVPALDDTLLAIRLEAVRVLAPVMSDLTSGQQELFRRALAEYIDAEELNADRIEAHMNLGILYSEIGEPEKAELSYRNGLRLEPQSVPLRVNLADLYRGMNRDPEAKQLLEEARTIDPKNPNAAHALGLLFVRQRQPDQALALLKIAAELAPEVARYGYVYAVALHSTGRPERAIEIASSALNRHPYDRSLLELMASMEAERGNTEQANAYIERLQSLDR